MYIHVYIYTYIYIYVCIKHTRTSYDYITMISVTSYKCIIINVIYYNCTNAKLMFIC